MGPLTQAIYEFILSHPEGVTTTMIWNHFSLKRRTVLLRILADLKGIKKIHDRKAQGRIFQAEEQLTLF